MNRKKIVEVNIDNLRLRTIIGFNDCERKDKQDVVVSISFKYDAGKAIESDDVEKGCNYKTIIKKVISEVENSRFKLLESLTDKVYSIVKEEQGVISANVKVDKPFALRFSDSVAVKISDSDAK